MKYTKSSVAVLFLLIFSTSVFSNSFGILSDCQLAQLNKAMQSKLDLSQEQVQKTWQLNQTYCSSRDLIYNNQKKIGKNTALLACWDKWVQGLSSVLTEAQMQKFMKWQSQVDLLGESAFWKQHSIVVVIERANLMRLYAKEVLDILDREIGLN